MDSLMKKFEHLEINLEEIKSATDNFNENKVIGIGGFGKVYKGDLSHSEGQTSLVAFKRLDGKFGQGGPEFFKEIRTLSCYRHENLVSLFGFCNEGGEMILVYEHAPGGSLDRLLSSSALTWTERLRICLDAAKGLSFLHDPHGTQQRVLHRDIKSSNILLDKDMNAKISDFGLSKIGPANQESSLIISDAIGTPGYCDPFYMETYSLTKESDVYSFGVVLFEVLCGRLCIENSNGQLKIYVPLWKALYAQKKLDDIIFVDLIPQMVPESLETFADIAFQCLQNYPKERPAMSLVVEKLEKALAVQVLHDLKLPNELEDIVKAAVPPLKYKSLKELKDLLSKGFHDNNSNTLFRINEKGEHIERIYIGACLNPDEIEARSLIHTSDEYFNSRFPGGLCYTFNSRFKACVRAQFLSPSVSYTVNLVFRYKRESDVRKKLILEYKLAGAETKIFIVYPTYMREDGWIVAELHQFTSQTKIVDLEFVFEKCDFRTLLVAGIEFQAIKEKVEQHDQEYQDILKASSQSLVYTSTEELKALLSVGVYLNGYNRWFWLNEEGQHCELISMKDCLIPCEDSTSQYEPHWISRFPAGLYRPNNKEFKTHVQTQLLSPRIIYSVNLVFDSFSRTKQAYVDLKYRLRGETVASTVYLAKMRDDGLYMAELYQFTSDGKIVDLEIDFDDHATNLRIEGILFQPLEHVGEALPNDYEEILKLSKNILLWTTKKELYSIFSRGFLIDDGQQWFNLDKNGKKCLMLSSRAVYGITFNDPTWESSHESRFGEVLKLTGVYKFEVRLKIKSQLVSPDTTYATYLVYELPQDKSAFTAPLQVKQTRDFDMDCWFIYLICPPNTPLIRTKFDENMHNLLKRPKLNDVPQQRSDGLMEVKLWQFQTPSTTETTTSCLELRHPGEDKLYGLIIHGFELRPL